MEETIATVYAKSPTDSSRYRLVVIAKSAHSRTIHNLTEHTFAKIAVEQLNKNLWKTLTVVTREDFETNFEGKRWVIDAFSLNITNNSAILKVAEMGHAQPYKNTPVVYSWQEWDLRMKQSTRVIRICRTPLESF